MEALHGTKSSLDYYNVFHTKKTMFFEELFIERLFFGEPIMVLLRHHCEKILLENLFLGVFKIFSFMFHRRKYVIQVWNGMIILGLTIYLNKSLLDI